MAKRSVTFADLEGEGPEEEPPLPPRKRAMSRFPGQPSLDSDEEEEDEDEAEGSSDFNLFLPHGSEESPEGAGPEEGEGPVTPFDLGPELAEGHFDPAGHFLWHPAPPPDPWLEAIEGLPIKPRPPARDVTASPPPLPSPPR
ncbi:CD2 antigen cytoplasmic tail-binding protein 2 [Melopsittacus undulatus]|uniref:CD2 antigen cytoplasmic tail-binding protein 2 n=1 Tax=Melopsittacus undulatus TaxID=13146 RepID=UPI00146E365E|nr:CD2 antigen cytoplasmic tail-binding protein 2 [Melopsittacus undulatus]